MRTCKRLGVFIRRHEIPLAGNGTPISFPFLVNEPTVTHKRTKESFLDDKRAKLEEKEMDECR